VELGLQMAFRRRAGTPVMSLELLVVISKVIRVLFVKWGCTLQTFNISPFFHKKKEIDCYDLYLKNCSFAIIFKVFMSGSSPIRNLDFFKKLKGFLKQNNFFLQYYDIWPPKNDSFCSVPEFDPWTCNFFDEVDIISPLSTHTSLRIVISPPQK
jgi:hypothetical protein